MIKELQKRPFIRPLFIWIIGIILQTFLSCRIVSAFFLITPVFFVLGFSFLAGTKKGKVPFETRWVWGILFVFLLLFLSIQRTAWSEIRRNNTLPVSRLELLADSGQQYLLKSFDLLRLTDTEKSVLATITVGYRKTMDRDTKKDFSITGVAHLLSVSGFHVAIVCGFLSCFFSCLPRKVGGKWIRYLLTIVLLWSFASITGLAASAVRAAVMLTLYLTGRVLRRTTDGYNTLAASAFCMLVYNPFYLFDIGFQLSYVAVLFILYLQPRLKKMIDVKNPLLATPWDWITMTVAAQIGTSCLCLYYFGQFSLVFLFTNLPLTFLATFLIPAGLIWILLPAGCPGYDWLQFAVELLTRSMLKVVEVFSQVPWAVYIFRFNLFTTCLGYGVLLFSLLFLRTKRPVHLLTTLSLLLIILLQMILMKYLDN